MSGGRSTKVFGGRGVQKCQGGKGVQKCRGEGGSEVSGGRGVQKCQKTSIFFLKNAPHFHDKTCQTYRRHVSE